MKDCRIIIPTFNRPDHLRRILSYYDSFREDFKIVIADSSSDENKQTNREIVASVLNLDIRYHDKYAPDIVPQYKFADAVDHVQEKYCVFCADDDFILPGSIHRCVAFLDSNQDFIAAHGQYVSFRVKYKHDVPKYHMTGEYMYKGGSVDFTDADKRFISQVTAYNPTFYAIHRTPTLQRAFNEHVEWKVDPDYFGELLLSLLTVIYGKVKRFRELHAFRDSGTPKFKPSLKVQYWPGTREAIKAGRCDGEYTRFKECLSENLCTNLKLNTEKSKEIVESGMSIYLSHRIPIYTRYRNRFLTRTGTMLDSMPNWISETTRKLYTAAFLRKTTNSPMYLDLSPSSEYYQDIERIRLHVLEHSRNYRI